MQRRRRQETTFVTREEEEKRRNKLSVVYDAQASEEAPYLRHGFMTMFFCHPFCTPRQTTSRLSCGEKSSLSPLPVFAEVFHAFLSR